MNKPYKARNYKEVLETIDGEVSRALKDEKVSEYERKFVKSKMEAMVGASRWPERYGPTWASHIFDMNVLSLLETCREWAKEGHTPDVDVLNKMRKDE